MIPCTWVSPSHKELSFPLSSPPPFSPLSSFSILSLPHDLSHLGHYASFPSLPLPCHLFPSLFFSFYIRSSPNFACLSYTILSLSRCGPSVIEILLLSIAPSRYFDWVSLSQSNSTVNPPSRSWMPFFPFSFILSIGHSFRMPHYPMCSYLTFIYSLSISDFNSFPRIVYLWSLPSSHSTSNFIAFHSDWSYSLSLAILPPLPTLLCKWTLFSLSFSHSFFPTPSRFPKNHLQFSLVTFSIFFPLPIIRPIARRVWKFPSPEKENDICEEEGE